MLFRSHPLESCQSVYKLPEHLHYFGVDSDYESIVCARETYPFMPLRNVGPGLGWRTGFSHADIFALPPHITSHAPFDLLIAHAVLDLLNLPHSLPHLFSYFRPRGILYFTLTFDCDTIFQPYHPLAPLINDLRLLAQCARAIPRMTEACRNPRIPHPQFVEVAGRLRVIIRSAPSAPGVAISQADQSVLDVLGKGSARTSEVAAELGKSVRWTRQRLIALVATGLAVELGEGPNDPLRRYALQTKIDLQ